MAKLITAYKTPTSPYINTILNAAIARRSSFIVNLLRCGSELYINSPASYDFFLAILE